MPSSETFEMIWSIVPPARSAESTPSAIATGIRIARAISANWRVFEPRASITDEAGAPCERVTEVSRREARDPVRVAQRQRLLQVVLLRDLGHLGLGGAAAEYAVGTSPGSVAIARKIATESMTIRTAAASSRLRM